MNLQRFTKRAGEESAAIPVVPPVIADALPAEEVLVRGAQEPIEEQSSVLLRAAEENADISAEQLLRAATMPSRSAIRRATCFSASGGLHNLDLLILI